MRRELSVLRAAAACWPTDGSPGQAAGVMVRGRRDHPGGGELTDLERQETATDCGHLALAVGRHAQCAQYGWMIRRRPAVSMRPSDLVNALAAQPDCVRWE